MSDTVILVDENDQCLGTGDKQGVHLRGELHRAFSVFLFDKDGHWLLQKRHEDKYHSGGLWTNTCCSHPAPGEHTGDAARRRLNMEMGVDVPIQRAFQFHYRAELDNGLTEHEVDHVYIGCFNGAPCANPLEVSDWRWVHQEELEAELATRPDTFTHWFRIAVPLVQAHLEPVI